MQEETHEAMIARICKSIQAEDQREEAEILARPTTQAMRDAMRALLDTHHVAEIRWYQNTDDTIVKCKRLREYHEFLNDLIHQYGTNAEPFPTRVIQAIYRYRKYPKTRNKNGIIHHLLKIVIEEAQVNNEHDRLPIGAWVHITQRHISTHPTYDPSQSQAVAKLLGYYKTGAGLITYYNPTFGFLVYERARPYGLKIVNNIQEHYRATPTSHPDRQTIIRANSLNKTIDPTNIYDLTGYCTAMGMMRLENEGDSWF